MKEHIKQLLAGAALAAACILLPAGPTLAQGYRLEVNGQPVTVAATLKDGQLMARTRSLAAAMGAQVRWDRVDKRILITRGGDQIALWIGSTTVFRNGVRFRAPTAPMLLGESSYVPAWFVAQLLGGRVHWDGQTMRVVTGSGAGTGYRLPSRNSRGVPDWVLRHPLGQADLIFPFPDGAPYDRNYTDNYGAPRTWSPNGPVQRVHTGIDIYAPKGTPLVAVGDGKVVRIGWNQYGGWRIQIALDAAPGYKVYYAHLNGYGKNLYEGARVRKGQVIGYVGRTGYGPEGHEGDFPPHLHFGIYDANYNTLNPYPFLKLWESR